MILDVQLRWNFQSVFFHYRNGELRSNDTLIAGLVNGLSVY